VDAFIENAAVMRLSATCGLACDAPFDYSELGAKTRASVQHVYFPSESITINQLAHCVSDYVCAISSSSQLLPNDTHTSSYSPLYNAIRQTTIF